MPTSDKDDLLKQTLSGSGILTEAAAQALKAGGSGPMLALLRHTLKDDRDGLKTLERMGDTFLRVGAPDDACECYRAGLAMAERMGEKERICRFHLALGSALDEAGRAPAALDVYRAGTTLAQAISHRGLESRFLNNLGILSQKGNDPKAAIPYYEASLAIKEGEKDVRGALSTRLNLASLLASLGRWKEVAPHVERILVIAHDAHDERSEAYGLLLKGQAFGASVEWHFASGPLQNALALFQRVADGEGELAASMSMAETAIELHDCGHAYVLLKAAQEMAERRKDGPRSARILTLFHRLDRTLAPPGRDHTTSPVEEVTRERNGLLKLQEFGKALNQEEDAQRLLERILDAAISLTSAERGLLMLREGEEMKVRVARNSFGPGGAAVAGDGVDTRVSRSIADSVARRGVPVISTSASRDKEWSAMQSVADFHLRATICVAVRTRGRILGVIYLDDRRRDHAFGLVDLRLLESLADQAALALAAAQRRAEAASGIRPREEAPASGAPAYPFEGKTLAEVERLHIEETLRAVGGDAAQAAQRLGISPEDLAARRARHGG